MDYIREGEKRAEELEVGDLIWKSFSARERCAVVRVVFKEWHYGDVFYLQGDHPQMGRIALDLGPRDIVQVMRENWEAEGSLVSGDEALSWLEGVEQPETDEEVEAAEWEQFIRGF